MQFNAFWHSYMFLWLLVFSFVCALYWNSTESQLVSKCIYSSSRLCPNTKTSSGFYIVTNTHNTYIRYTLYHAHTAGGQYMAVYGFMNRVVDFTFANANDLDEDKVGLFSMFIMLVICCLFRHIDNCSPVYDNSITNVTIGMIIIGAFLLYIK